MKMASLFGLAILGCLSLKDAEAQTFVVTACPATVAVGAIGQSGRPYAIDVNGNICTGGGSGGGGLSVVDGVAFTAGTSPFTPGGGFFQTTATANPLTNGQQGMQQFTAQRAGFVNLRNSAGAEIMTWPVTGTFFQATQPVSAASLPLPTGASTEATQLSVLAAIQGDVPSVTGPLAAAAAAATKSLMVGGQFLTTQPTMTNTQQASLLFSPRGAVYVMTGAEKLLVTPDSVALPANQSVNVAQINAVTPLMGNGVTGTGSPRVTLASDGTAISTTGFMSVKLDQTTLGTTNGVTDAPANSSPTNISATTSGTPSTATTLLAASATHHKVVLKVEGASTVCFSQFGTAVIDSNGTWCLKGASSNNAGDGGSYVTPQGMTEPNAISMISTGTSVRVTGWWQ